MGDPAPRRGPAVAIALLTVAFLVAATLAAIQFVRLRDAERRIEQLEAETGDRAPEGGGILDRLRELIEGLTGDQGGDGQGLGGVAGCLDVEVPPAGEGSEATGGGIAAQVRAIAERVEQIRELRFEEPVEPELLSPEETSRRIRELFLEEYTVAMADVEGRMLAALGAMRPGTDLRAVVAEAIGQQVVGFYVPETGELVVRTAGGRLSAVDRVTLAHELQHALADQALELPLPDDPVPGREDADLAALALVEGDATLTMQLYAASLPFEDQLGLIGEGLAGADAGLEALPYYLRRQLLFPYESGLAFVCHLYRDGGWAAVDRAYREPPVSTAEVLFPERYLERSPEDPADPSGPGTAWRSHGARELGAAQLTWLLEAPGGDRNRALDDPASAARAWAGGEAHVWTRGEDTALGLALAERPNEDVLCSAVSHWYASAFPRAQPSGSALAGGLALDGTRQDAVLVCSDDEVRLGVAPDLPTARRLVR